MQCVLNVIVGFGPTATADYDNQLFPRKINREIHFTVAIKCNTAANGNSQLLEIRICFTATGDLDDCKNNVGDKKYIARDCNSRIIFPAQRERRDEL